MSKYRNESGEGEVEAMQWTADNHMELAIFMNVLAMESSGDEVYVPTLEGSMKAIKGNWIIKGKDEELSICNSDIFEAMYELV